MFIASGKPLFLNHFIWNLLYLRQGGAGYNLDKVRFLIFLYKIYLVYGIPQKFKKI